MDTALTQKFQFTLDRNLAKPNCTGNRVCTSCDTVVPDTILKCIHLASHSYYRWINRVARWFRIIGDNLNNKMIPHYRCRKTLETCLEVPYLVVGLLCTLTVLPSSSSSFVNDILIRRFFIRVFDFSSDCSICR